MTRSRLMKDFLSLVDKLHNDNSNDDAINLLMKIEKECKSTRYYNIGKKIDEYYYDFINDRGYDHSYYNSNKDVRKIYRWIKRS